MNVAAEAHAGGSGEKAGLIGRIPVRNVWLLMLYASRLLRYLDVGEKKGAEENPDDIADLAAEISGTGSQTAHEAESRLRVPEARSRPRTCTWQNRPAEDGTGPPTRAGQGRMPF